MEVQQGTADDGAHETDDYEHEGANAYNGHDARSHGKSSDEHDGDDDYNEDDECDGDDDDDDDEEKNPASDAATAATPQCDNWHRLVS